MSLVDVDTWVTELEACERLSHDIQSQIVLRDRETSRLSDEYSRISSTARNRLRQFKTELKQLKIKLDLSSQSGVITFEEQERRQRQIENLQSKQVHLENKFRGPVGQNERMSLFDTPAATGSIKLFDDDDDAPIIESNSIGDLRRQQLQMLENQNEGLDTLSQTLARQKQLAVRLGEEVGQQNDILDTLADNMERIDTRVNVETRHIGLVTRQDRTCGYWLVILVLGIAIVIVALI